MNNIWNKIYNIIGITNLSVGLIILFKVFDLIEQQVIQMEKLSEQTGLSRFDVSFFDLLTRNWIQLTIGILFISSGALMLLRRKVGWILGYSSWIIATLFCIPIAIYGIRDITVTTIGPDYWIKIYSGIGLLFSLAFLTILSLKPIRIINKIKRKSWLMSFGIVLLLYLTARIV